MLNRQKNSIERYIGIFQLAYLFFKPLSLMF